MQLFDRLREKKKILQILPKCFFFIKKMQYGKTSYSRQDQT
jgi:hypothetical protein